MIINGNEAAIITMAFGFVSALAITYWNNAHKLRIENVKLTELCRTQNIKIRLYAEREEFFLWNKSNTFTLNDKACKLLNLACNNNNNNEASSAALLLCKAINSRRH